MEISIKATTVFQRNWDALHTEGIRFIKNEGGSRSSKTYSICQALILWSIQNPRRVVSVVRKTGPALSATVMRDFLEVLKELGLWSEKNWSKGGRCYTFDNGTIVEFFSVDSEQKLRGRKRDMAWVNEANELHYDDFQQLNLRTTGKIIVDYNPSEVDSYLYALPDDKTISIHSTYLDNPFLSQSIIDEIEGYKTRDEDYYTIFGLGRRAYSRENVYVEWPTRRQKPNSFTDFVYAIDYGYQHPTALVKIYFNPEGREAHIEELIYESYLTSSDIVEKMNSLKLDKSKPVISETARPEIIADLRRAGYRMVEANKNVKDGINTVKTFAISVDEFATNIRKENQNYRYKKHNGVVTEEIVKQWDDAMDAIRYGLMYVKKHCLRETNSSKQVYQFNL